MKAQPALKRKLGVFAVTMINIIAVDSLRTLPFSASFGAKLLVYYALAALCFFLPIAFVTAELATGWPSRGGIYIWIREAFGEKWGFVIIWLQWVYNIVWYPTILAFIAGTIAYMTDPALAENKWFMLSVILLIFWLSTAVNCLSLRVSSWISTIGALMGTLVPMAFIMLLGLGWVLKGNPSQLDFSLAALRPNLAHNNDWSYLLAILFGLIGVEVSATHADEVDAPQTTFPKAIFYSTLIIFSSLVLSSLSIAMVVPQRDLNMITGLTQAFQLFLNHYQLEWMNPLVSLLIILGGIAGVATWIISPTKGLMVAAQDGNIPAYFANVNRHGSPYVLLLLQALICTLLSSIFLFMPTVSSSYWILTAITAQLAMLVYVAVFAAAIYLRYKQPQVVRAYQIPGGKMGLWLIGLLGITSSTGAIFLGFVPPLSLHWGNPHTFYGLILVGMVGFLVPPFLLYQSRK